MKTIKIQFPDSTKAVWEDGVLTCVDEKRSVTERIKTFEDACRELGEDHKLVRQYNACAENGLYYCETTKIEDKDIVAYLKLRIIAAALNEGWQPQFTTDEYRYFPWFYLYTEEEIDDLSEGDKECIYRFPNTTGYAGIYSTYAKYYSPSPDTAYGFWLAFKTSELAIYAGKQFIDIWIDYIYK